MISARFESLEPAVVLEFAFAIPWDYRALETHVHHVYLLMVMVVHRKSHILLFTSLVDSFASR